MSCSSIGLHNHGMNAKKRERLPLFTVHAINPPFSLQAECGARPGRWKDLIKGLRAQ
jgi:hypothetical protein